jgi:general secretion pathway protein D
MQKIIKIIFLTIITTSFSVNALMLNLKNVEIKTLINTVAMANGKNFMIDPRVKGRVNIISNKEIDGDQLYQVFLTILKAHGFVVIEGENVSRIVPKNLTKSESAYVSSKATDAIFTKVMYLKSVDAAKIVPIIRPLMSAYGLLSIYAPNNSLIIIDTGSNIARLEDIIAKLDKPMDDDFEFIKIKNSSAEQIAATIKPLFAKQSGLLTITVDKHNNQLILSGNKDRRLKVRLLISELDKYKVDAGTTAIIYLKYANAKDILPVLQGINQHNATAKKDAKVIKSNIQANEATNSIIVTGDNETKQTVRNIIAKLDVRRAQVLIEAIIAEVSTSDAKELGIQWIAKGGAGLGITNLNGALPALIGTAGGDSSALANGFQGGVNFMAGKFDENTQKGFGVLINALNSTGNTNILSTPSILTLDNHEAEIVVGQEVPFITNTQLSSSGTNPFQNYERKDVGLKLKVKPQINDGSSIKLEIAQEISNVMNSSSAADLITSKRTLNTSVMVEDGKMLILGGLIDDTWRDSIAKVPLLGDLPLLGKLFSYKTKSKGKSNLMIFIRPTIIKDQILSNSVSMEKYNYIKAKQLLNYQDSAIKDIDSFLASGENSQPLNKKEVVKNKVAIKPTVKYVEKQTTTNAVICSVKNQPLVYKNNAIGKPTIEFVAKPSNNIFTNKTIRKPVPVIKIKPQQAIIKTIEKTNQDTAETINTDGYLDKKPENDEYKSINNSPYYIK